MEHYEAIEMMASERYLLDELTPELRDAYEEHMFGCTECASDLRFGAALVDNAKAVLRGETPTAVVACLPVKAVAEKHDWFAWLRQLFMVPAFTVPAFACLLALVGYQNLVVYPVLEASAVEPRLLPSATVLQGATRGSLPIVDADPVTGSMVTVPLTQSTTYDSYKFDLYDAKGKLIWTHTIHSSGAADDMTTIWLPGRVKDDRYKLTVNGVTATGENIPLQDQLFELRSKK